MEWRGDLHLRADYAQNERMLLTRFDGGGLVTEQTHFNDSRVKEVIDYSRSNFNRSHSYDHVGRLISASAGTTAPKPYDFTYGYDAWNNTTSRTGTYGSCNAGFTASYTNNRDNAMQYDTAGNVIYTPTGTGLITDFEYDSAGRLETFRQRDPNVADVSVQVIHIHDGDGREVYRSAETHDNNGNPYYRWHYVRSSMLGGAVVATIRSDQNHTEFRGESRVYLHGEQIAYQRYGYPGDPPGYRQVIWVYHNPVIRGRYLHNRLNNHLGQPQDNVFADDAVDPMGALVGQYGTCSSPPSNPPQDTVPIYGNVYNPQSGCYLDGAEAPCNLVMLFANSGAAVIGNAPMIRFNYDTRQFEFFRAYADGTQGWAGFNYVKLVQIKVLWNQQPLNR